MKRRTKMIAIAIMSLSLTVTVGCTPTSKSKGNKAKSERAGSKYECDTGNFCLWSGKSYGGDIVQFSPSKLNTCVNVTGLDNKATALWNNTKRHVQVFVESDCRGKSWEWRPGHRAENVNVIGMQDQISSIKWAR